MSALISLTGTPAMAASARILAFFLTASSFTPSSIASLVSSACAFSSAAWSILAWFSGDCSTAGGGDTAGGGLASSSWSGSNVSTNEDLISCSSRS